MISEKAKWVTTDSEAPIIFRSFVLPQQCKKAKLSICGLGFFEAYVNGEKVSEDLLVPAWSDYEHRADKKLLYPLSDRMTYCTYYMIYDVTDRLKAGENLLEVWLGNGWYNQHERNVEGNLWYGMPKLIFTLDWTDEAGVHHQIDSDTDLLWKESPITFNNVYFGEHWDFTREQTEVKAVKPAPETKTELYHQTCPPDRVIRIIKPTLIGKDGEADIWDAGENITGFIRCVGVGTVEITYAEELYQNGQMDYTSAGGEGQIQTDRYLTHEKRTLQPKFSIKGFRYARISGNVQDVEVVVVHADVKVNAVFNSSDPTLNWLYDAYLRTQLNNMHSGIVSDCPHRERLGYTGDGQLTAPASMLLTDSKRFYQKWICDILDSQDPDSGHVQHTAPFYGGGGGPGGWGGAIVMVPYYYHNRFCDAATLMMAYPQMLKWFDYMVSRCENDLVMREEKDGWCLGDWCTPEKIVLEECLVNTYYFIITMDMMMEIGTMLGKNERLEELESQHDRSLEAMRRKYADKKEFVQGEDAFLADLGLLSEQQIEQMAQKYDALGGYDTGIFGTYVLTKVLFDNGYADIAYKLLSSHKFEHSYGYMMDCGATTLWEDWNGVQSHDHPMFGAVVELLFTKMLGIEMIEPGYKVVNIHPNLPRGLNFVEGSIMTRYGPICVKYDKNAVEELQITVPKEVVMIGGNEYE